MKESKGITTTSKSINELSEYNIAKIANAQKRLNDIVVELTGIEEKLNIFNQAMEYGLDGVRTPYKEVKILKEILATTKAQQQDIHVKYLELSEYIKNLSNRLEIFD
jgi:hypothetical protein